MDEEEKRGGADAGGEGKIPEFDAFGQPTKEETPPKKRGGKSEDGGEKKYADIPEDHPTLVALRGEVEKIKKEYGGNLSGQREVIERLEKEIKVLRESKGESGKTEGGDEDVPFKEIKTSKDLTDEEKEEMTETEIKQYDQIAMLMQTINKLAGEISKKSKEESGKSGEDLKKFVQNTARALAKESAGKDDTDLTNAIIDKFNGMRFNLEGLDEEAIAERVKVAATQVSEYKPPKEQTTKRGKTPKGAYNDEMEDPFGIDAIVEAQGKGNDGEYNL